MRIYTEKSIYRLKTPFNILNINLSINPFLWRKKSENIQTDLNLLFSDQEVILLGSKVVDWARTCLAEDEEYFDDEEEFNPLSASVFLENPEKIAQYLQNGLWSETIRDIIYKYLIEPKKNKQADSCKKIVWVNTLESGRNADATWLNCSYIDDLD